MHDGARWIFGYGSLVWRPAFPHAERRAANVRGWVRRFWQGSPEHRGVRDAPGRVLTLAPRPEALRDLQVHDAHIFTVAELLAET